MKQKLWMGVLALTLLLAMPGALAEVCEETYLVVSDTTWMIGDQNAVETYDDNAAWTADIPGATWIWSHEFVQNPTQDEFVTMTKTFMVTGTPTTATLLVASDNSYEVTINGNPAGADAAENNHALATQDSYDVSSLIVEGNNTISATVQNWAGNADPTVNPAGLLLRIDGETQCPVVPQEVCGDGIVNQISEECDGTDGVTDGFSCSDQCLLVADPVCGDGLVNQLDEECDGTDGVTDGFTCSDQCVLEQIEEVNFCAQFLHQDVSPEASTNIFGVDPDTGIATLLVTYPEKLRSVVATDKDGVLYSVRRDGSNSGDLVILNPDGTITTVGDTNLQGNVVAMEFSPDGILYLMGQETDDLFVINTSTGAATKLADLTFDVQGGDLLVTVTDIVYVKNDGRVFTVDRTTFDATEVGTVPSTGFTSAAIFNQTMYAMDKDLDALYTFTVDPFSVNLVASGVGPFSFGDGTSCAEEVEAVCGDGIVNQESEQCDGEDGVGPNQVCSPSCQIFTNAGVDPIFECWEVDPENQGMYRAHFGWENLNGINVTVPHNSTFNEVIPASFESQFPEMFSYPAPNHPNGSEGRTGLYPDTAIVIDNWDGDAILWQLTDQGVAIADLEGPMCAAVCGDGIVGGEEECDGSAPTGYMCTDTCQLQAVQCVGNYCEGGSIPGTANIEPGNSEKPVIEYIWVLPDESPDEGTQVEIVPSGERNDIYSCIVVSDVDSRDTIEDVFVDLYHPDESFKYQVHAERLDPVTQADEIESCKTLARDHGLISSQDWEDINYDIFSQPNWHMYKVYLPMYYHQPSGEYRLEAYAVDTASTLSDPLNGSFEWVAGTYLEMDFDSIDFGNIQPGAWKILNGDTDMSTPNMPTLKNEGNTEVQVGVEFSEFVGQGDLPNKVIDRFDAQLRNMGTDNYNGIPGEHLEFNANERVDFTHPIGLCRQEKIDFSIHADVGTVPDDYAGSVTIYATPVIVDSPPTGSSFPVDDE